MIETFENFRPKLFAIAYRMLGNATEAEDMVQEAYLRFQATPLERVQSPEAFLKTIVTRLCLDYLKSAQAQREEYPGEWLPEPIFTGDQSEFVDPAEQASEYESLSLAFLLLLESLSPDERAVFLLREVFDYNYAEIASMLDKSEVVCRQLLSRAKKHVVEHRPRFKSSPDEHRLILAQFMQAIQAGDLTGLTALLAEGVTASADGGGKVRAIIHPLQGPVIVGRFIFGLRRLIKPDDSVEIAPINGKEALLIRDHQGHITDVITFEIADGAIQKIYIIRNPDKLKHIP